MLARQSWSGHPRLTSSQRPVASARALFAWQFAALQPDSFLFTRACRSNTSYRLVGIRERLPDPTHVAGRCCRAEKAGAVALVAGGSGLLHLQQQAVAVTIDAQLADVLDVTG